MCKGFGGSVAVLRDGRKLPVRLLAEGGEAPPIADGKDVRQRVDRAKAEPRSRPTWKPPPDHPWRRSFKPQAIDAAAGQEPRYMRRTAFSTARPPALS